MTDIRPPSLILGDMDNDKLLLTEDVANDDKRPILHVTIEAAHGEMLLEIPTAQMLVCWLEQWLMKARKQP